MIHMQKAEKPEIEKNSPHITKEELDRCSTCDFSQTINDGLSDVSREKLKGRTGEEIVDADIAAQTGKTEA